MGYWIGLVTSDRNHYNLCDCGVHCSWNLSDLMVSLDCGWARDWQGKQAKDMIEPIKKSLDEIKVLRQNGSKYSYETTENCIYVLGCCLETFSVNPNGIIIIE